MKWIQLVFVAVLSAALAVAGTLAYVNNHAAQVDSSSTPPPVLQAKAPKERKAPTDILGMQFGAPLTMKPCVISAENERPCSRSGMPDNGKSKLGINGAQYLVEVAAPPGIVADGVMVYTVDGKLALVAMQTKGLEVQKAIFDMLVAKYGEPTAQAVVTSQNRMGASFDGIKASWLFDNVNVSFRGFSDKIDSGNVLVTTPEGTKYLNAIDADDKSKQPRL